MKCPYEENFNSLKPQDKIFIDAQFKKYSEQIEESSGIATLTTFIREWEDKEKLAEAELLRDVRDIQLATKNSPIQQGMKDKYNNDAALLYKMGRLLMEARLKLKELKEQKAKAEAANKKEDALLDQPSISKVAPPSSSPSTTSPNSPLASRVAALRGLGGDRIRKVSQPLPSPEVSRTTTNKSDEQYPTQPPPTSTEAKANPPVSPAVTSKLSSTFVPYNKALRPGSAPGGSVSLGSGRNSPSLLGSTTTTPIPSTPSPPHHPGLRMLATGTTPTAGLSDTSTGRLASRPVVAAADAPPNKPNLLPSSQSKIIMDKINVIAEQVASKKINIEKASEEITHIIMQMDRDMHANLKKERDQKFPSISVEQRTGSLAASLVTTPVTLSEKQSQTEMPKDERLLNLEPAELAKYIRAYEIVHFYLESPAQQKADIDALKYVVRSSIIACDPLMAEIFEIEKRITEIERLQQIEKREDWEKKQVQNDLEKRITNPENALLREGLEAKLKQLKEADTLDYAKKLPIITILQQEKEELGEKFKAKEKLLIQRSQAWFAGELDKTEKKQLGDIIDTKERVFKLWLKVAEILYVNHDYEGLFQVQSVLNQLYGTIELKGENKTSKTADIKLDSESAKQLKNYAEFAGNNSLAKDVMRKHLDQENKGNKESFIPLLAITAPALNSATILLDPLVKLIKPETNLDSLESRARKIEEMGTETRILWEKKLNSMETPEADKKRLEKDLAKSDSEIGKEVLKKKLESTERAVSKVITDTDSLESCLPRSVLIKPESLLSKAKIIELDTGEVVSGIAQRSASTAEIDRRIDSMSQIRDMQQKVLIDLEKGTEKDKIIAKKKELIELNMSLSDVIDEKLKIIDPNEFGQHKKCYEEKEKCLFNALYQSEMLVTLISDKKSKILWNNKSEEFKEKRSINQEFKLLAYDNVSTANYANFLKDLKINGMHGQECSNLTSKKSQDLLSSFSNERTSEGREHYHTKLSNLKTRIELFSIEFKPDILLSSLKQKLEGAISALSLNKDLDRILECGKNPQSIEEITRYKNDLKSIYEKAGEALKKLEKFDDPSTISIILKLKHIADASRSLDEKFQTRVTLSPLTSSQIRASHT